MSLICASFTFYLFFLFFIALLNKLIDGQDDLPNLLPPLDLRILLQIKIYQLQPHMQGILRPQNQFSLLISHPHQLWLRTIDIFPHLNQSLPHRAFKFTTKGCGLNELCYLRMDVNELLPQWGHWLAHTIQLHKLRLKFLIPHFVYLIKWRIFLTFKTVRFSFQLFWCIWLYFLIGIF